MRGIGRTVLRSTQIEEFEVEILGVLQTSSPGGQMILGRVSGLGLEETGIVAGMSGSPIYVEGRLVGALAFGWPFATEPIAGITPIQAMLDLQTRSGGVSGTMQRRAGLDHATWEALLSAPRDAVMEVLSRSPASSISGQVVPLQVPVSLGGWHAGAASQANRILETMGFLPVQGGTFRADSTVSETVLEPGSAVGVELVRGDAGIAAIGTVTWVEGSRILAFGHRMLNLGTTAYPLSAARILTVMPRQNSSFKVGVTGITLGAVTGDYNTGVLGELGRPPRLVPVDVALSHGEQVRDLHFEVLDAERLTPALAGLVVLNSVESLVRGAGPSTMRVVTTVSLEGGREVTASTVLAGFSPAPALAGEVARMVGLLHGNPFEPTGVTGVEIKAELEDEIQAVFLDRIFIQPDVYHPGDSVPLTLGFRDYRGAEWSHEAKVMLPLDLAPGTFRLIACDGIQALRLDQERAPSRYAPKSMDQLISLLESSIPYDHLVIRLLGDSKHPVVGGRELPRLPRSLLPAIASTSASGRAGEAEGAILVEQTENLGKVLLGCESLTLTVEP
jgi:hypothetical protein